MDSDSVATSSQRLCQNKLNPAGGDVWRPAASYLKVRPFAFFYQTCFSANVRVYVWAHEGRYVVSYCLMPARFNPLFSSLLFSLSQ